MTKKRPVMIKGMGFELCDICSTLPFEEGDGIEVLCQSSGPNNEAPNHKAPIKLWSSEFAHTSSRFSATLML